MTRALKSNKAKKDWYMEKGPRGMSNNRVWKTCYVIKHSGASHQISHPLIKNKWFTLNPHCLNNVPLTVGQMYDGKEGYDVLSKAEGDKYIDRAREIIIKNNREAFDENEEFRGTEGFKANKLQNKLIKEYGLMVSPYTCYLDALAKKRRGKKKKDKKE